jgi:hypothetical protein
MDEADCKIEYTWAERVGDESHKTASACVARILARIWRVSQGVYWQRLTLINTLRSDNRKQVFTFQKSRNQPDLYD